MSATFFQLPEPLTQLTQKIWQEQVAQTTRLVAEAQKIESELSARTQKGLEESSRLVKSSFDYAFGIAESFRNATLSAMKDWSTFGADAGKASE